MPVRASGGAGPAPASRKKRIAAADQRIANGGKAPSVGEATNQLAARFALKAGNRKAAAEHVAAADSYARSPGKQRLKPVASPRQRFDEASRKSSGATVDAAGAARVLAGHALGLGRASLPWNMPGTVAKTGKFIGESTLGLGALLARAQHAGSVMDNIKPHSDRESPVELGRALLGASGEHYSKKLGPAYRGDKGGVDHLAEEVFKDPAGSALDAVSVIAPLDLAATGTVRAARAAAGRPGIKYIDERPDIRKAATGPAEAQRTARTVSGATVLKATDAARTGAQAGAKRLAARRAERAAASKATNRKPLPSVRAAVKPGEVAPLTAKSTAARHARKQSATAFAQGGARADYRTNEAIEPVVEAAKKTSTDNHYAARVALQFGIRDSAAAKAFLAEYVPYVEAHRAAALAGKPAPGRKVKGDAARVEYAAAQAAAEGELPALRALLDDPRVFDDPGVHALADTLDQAGRKVEAARIIEPGRATMGRSKPRGDVLGVKTAQELNGTGRKAQVAEHKAARKEAKDAYKERDKARATGARVLAGARADLAKAKGRAEILSRNVSGKERIPGDKAAGRAPSYAGGGHGVRQAEAALAKAQAAVDAKVGGATERLVLARERLSDARKPEPRIVETPQQFAAREQAVAAKLGLKPAGYVHAGLGIRPQLKARTPGTGNRRANPLAKNVKRTGVLTKLGRNEASLGDTAKILAAEIRKGTLDQAAGTMLRTHGVHVPDEAAAYQWARENGISKDSFENDMAVWKHAEPGADKPQLYIVPKAQLDEWEALRAQEGKLSKGAVGVLRRIASTSQAVLLGSNPGWWTFQRVNNAIALTAGRTNPAHYRELLRVRKTLTPAEREALATFTGGPSTRSFVSVNMFDDLGTLQRIIDNDPRYRATEKVKNVASVLLRSDAKLEHTVREMQLLNNLAKQIGPDVGTVLKAFRPAGRAMADGDANALGRMLSDEGYIRQLEEGVEALNRVHGSWASLTAQERRFKSFVAFYGFLRYATKLAFATLPVRHPLLTAMLLQEGAAENRYYESVLGKDYPYARGTLLDSKGHSLGSMKRALPVAGGGMDLAQAISSGNITAAAARGASPALAVVLNTLSGQKLSLDASGEGRVSKPKFEDDEAIGGMFSSNRAKWLANQASTLLGPVQALNATDRRKQTDESLPWARSYQTRSDIEAKLSLEEDNAERQKQGGALGAGRSLAPLLFGTPGTGENLKLKAARATTRRIESDAAARTKKAKAKGDRTPLGKARIRQELIDAKLDRSMEAVNARIKAAEQRIKDKLLAAGLEP